MDENRHRHTVWMDDNVWVQVESHYQRDNCTTIWTRNLPLLTCFVPYPMCWRASWAPWANGWDAC